ncbi:hypothetical protein T265_13624, partial [Opisthorchis viverrini]
MPHKGGTSAGILPGCPSLDRRSRVRTTDLPDGDRVILTVPGWIHYKIWLPTDVSGVPVVSFYPYCLSECLEVLSNKSWLYGSEALVLNTDVMLSLMMMMMYYQVAQVQTGEVERQSLGSKHGPYDTKAPSGQAQTISLITAYRLVSSRLIQNRPLHAFQFYVFYIIHAGMLSDFHPHGHNTATGGQHLNGQVVHCSYASLFEEMTCKHVDAFFMQKTNILAHNAIVNYLTFPRSEKGFAHKASIECADCAKAGTLPASEQALRPRCLLACTHCIHFSCWHPRHLEVHRKERPEHVIYICVERGELYCALCSDFVYHPVAEQSRKTAHRMYLAHFGLSSETWRPSFDELTLLPHISSVVPLSTKVGGRLSLINSPRSVKRYMPTSTDVQRPTINSRLSSLRQVCLFVKMPLGYSLIDVKYAHDVALLGSGAIVIQTTLNNLTNSA